MLTFPFAQDELLFNEAKALSLELGRPGGEAFASPPFVGGAAVASLQGALLSSTLEGLSKSPFYRRKLAGAKEALTETAELGRALFAQVPSRPDAAFDELAFEGPLRRALSKLPFTGAEELLDYRECVCTSLDGVERVVSIPTSGSTGAPKRVAFSREELMRTSAFFAAGMSQIVGEGKSLLVCLPGGERPFGVADLLRRGLEPLGVKVDFLPSASSSGDFLRAVHEQRPGCLVLAPSQLACLLQAFPDGAPGGLCSALVSADWCPPKLREEARSRLGIELIDHYGLTESCFGCSLECVRHDGWHVRHLELMCEIVDPRSGEPLPYGEVGELVLTTLRRTVMPLLRYRTGDVASLRRGPCACGSPLSRMGPVLGRIDRGTFAIAHPVKASRPFVAPSL